MKLLIFWDVYGRVWRNALIENLASLRKKYEPDFVIANADNLSSWRGPIEKHILELEKAGVDIIPVWNHLFDNFEKIKDNLSKDDSKVLRFANLYDDNLEWKWFKVFEKNWKRLLIINLQWEAFMSGNVNNPFLVAKKIIEEHKKEKLDWIVIDFHREASSEIQFMRYYLDWEISLVYWTHTHVQTNDDMIFPSGTWIMGDVWMCGPLESIIWADFESVKSIFLLGTNKWKIIQSTNKKWLLSWIFVEISDMKCINIEKIKLIWW